MSSSKRCPRSGCPHAGELQPLENFHRNRTRPDGRAAHCKDCANANNRRRRSKTGRGWVRYRKPDGFSGVGTPKRLLDAGLEKVAQDLAEYRQERQGTLESYGLSK